MVTNAKLTNLSEFTICDLYSSHHKDSVLYYTQCLHIVFIDNKNI